MMMKGNIQGAASCSVPVHHSTFYSMCVELKNVTNPAKKSKWCKFLTDNRVELSAQKKFAGRKDFLLQNCGLSYHYLHHGFEPG